MGGDGMLSSVTLRISLEGGRRPSSETATRVFATWSAESFGCEENLSERLK
jgi:hypothetical protein